MRGKKSDSAFVTVYIQESVLAGCNNPITIADRAKKRIQEIDEQIRKVEELKLERSKLLDVVFSFEKVEKNKTGEARVLSFFKLNYPDICKFLCQIIQNGPIDIGSNFQSLGSGDPNPHMKFSIKQMIECRILSRVGDTVIRGDRFDEYMSFIA